MTKVSPGARVYTVVSEKDADQFAVTAKKRCDGLDMSREQAAVLLEEGYDYADEFAVYSKSPRPGKVRKLLERVEIQAGAAAQVLNELTTEKIPDSGTDRLAGLKRLDKLDPGAVAAHYIQRHRKGERDLRTLSTDMQKLSVVASELLKRITADRGGRDDDPFIHDFILFAHSIYEKAGGEGKGSNEKKGKYSGPFFDLVELTLKLTVRGRFDKTNSALGNSIDRALEVKPPFYC